MAYLHLSIGLIIIFMHVRMILIEELPLSMVLFFLKESRIIKMIFKQTFLVFSIHNENLCYECSFEDKSNTTNYCISTISVKNLQNQGDLICVTGSRRNFKIWNITANQK